jgi:hypothetical protein
MGGILSLDSLPIVLMVWNRKFSRSADSGSAARSSACLAASNSLPAGNACLAINKA